MSYKVALLGNPNTGKSSIFNTLTKLKQHTGNWSGTTLRIIKGRYKYQNEDYQLTDTPGTYSLMGYNKAEVIARDHICFDNPDVVLVVCDANTIEKNLNLVFQVLEYTHNVIMVINFIDEAKNHGIKINRIGLIYELGIPVVFTNAMNNEGIDELKKEIHNVVNNTKNLKPLNIKYEKLESKRNKLKDKLYFTNNRDLLSLRILDAGNRFFNSYFKHYPDHHLEIKLLQEGINTEGNRKYVLSQINQKAKEIVEKHVHYEKDNLVTTKKIDNYITSKLFGLPIMFLMLILIFYITIKFAQYPTNALFSLFSYIENKLINFAALLKINNTITNFLILGIYRIIAYLIALLLPPMAIFFALFTFLEDIGYLPRVAYNLDSNLQKHKSHNKQTLSMYTGIGCHNYRDVNLINTKKDYLITKITDTRCNGRFPLLITLVSTFFVIFAPSFLNTLFPSIIATLTIIIGISITYYISNFLSNTLLKINKSHLTLELPPFRKPKAFRIISTSLINRTSYTLLKILIVSIPIGVLIWILSNTYINEITTLSYLINCLQPFGNLLGMDGVIIIAFILTLPSKLLLFPIIIATYMSYTLDEPICSIDAIHHLLINNGWTVFTLINLLLFSLLQYPCATTPLHTYNETKSIKKAFVSFIIPIMISIIICVITNLIFKLFKA